MPTETCPKCGDTFERETEEAARRSTAAHMSSKVDDEHQGISYPKAEALIDISKTSVSEPDESPDIKDESSKDAEPQPAVTDGGGLGLSGPVATDEPSESVEQENGDDDRDDQGEETVDCPHCGEDTELTPSEHEQGQRYRCNECGGRYRWT